MRGYHPQLERTTYDPIAQEGHVHPSLRLVVTDSDTFEDTHESISLNGHELVVEDRWALIERCRALDIVVCDALEPFLWGRGPVIRRRPAPRRNARTVVCATRMQPPGGRAARRPRTQRGAESRGIVPRHLTAPASSAADSVWPSWCPTEPECRRCAQLPPFLPAHLFVAVREAGGR